MLQAIGLTSAPRRDLPPAVRDLTFDALPGQVTALLGTTGSGKSTTLRLLLGLEQGRGATRFRGEPLQRVALPAREVGALLEDLPGHPARTARGQLRMVCAAAGTPLARADEMLEAVGLAGCAGRRLDTLPLGAARRLGLAAALLGDPCTLLLDQPAQGLPPAERDWWHNLMRARADGGGTVLCTTDDPRDAARFADRVLTLDAGRLVADQGVAAFREARLRPRVVVRTPHAARLADLVRREARAARRPLRTAVGEHGNLLSVYGGTCAEVGETAFRHGVLVHLLAEDVGPATPAGPAPDALDAPSALSAPPTPVAPVALAAGPASVPAVAEAEAAPRPGGPPEPRRTPPPRALGRRSPLARSLRYEVLRMLGAPAAMPIVSMAVVCSLALCVLLARAAHTPVVVALAAWPGFLPLPPAAFGAGLIGALSFGEEFRHPPTGTAATAAHGAACRRPGLLTAKLVVTAVAALLTALLVAAADLGALRLVYGGGGGGAAALPGDWPALLAGWCALCVGCAWAGLLAAGLFRVTAAGVAAVLAVPVVVAPLAQQALAVPAARSIAGLPGRLRALVWTRLPGEADGWLSGLVRTFAQPVGLALMLSLCALICAYLVTTLRRRASC